MWRKTLLHVQKQGGTTVSPISTNEENDVTEISDFAVNLWDELQSLAQQTTAFVFELEGEELAYEERLHRADTIRIKFRKKLYELGIQGFMVQHDVVNEGKNLLQPPVR